MGIYKYKVLFFLAFSKSQNNKYFIFWDKATIFKKVKNLVNIRLYIKSKNKIIDEIQ